MRLPDRKKNGGDGHHPLATLLVAIKNNFKNPGLSDPGQVIIKDKDYFGLLQDYSYKLGQVLKERISGLTFIP
jgi:hypothetical protein